jgi:hypothetical protein
MDYSNHITVKWLLRLFAYISQELPMEKPKQHVELPSFDTIEQLMADTTY